MRTTLLLAALGILAPAWGTPQLTARPVSDVSPPGNRGADVLFSTLGGVPSPQGVVTSQNFTDLAGFSAAADDFTIPASDRFWFIDTVKVLGDYAGAAGVADSVNVYILGDSAGLPDTTNLSAGSIYALENSPYTDTDSGDFLIALPGSLLLPAGSYWLVVQVNMSSGAADQWYWGESASAVDSGLPTGFESAWFHSGGVFSVACEDVWGPRISGCAVDGGGGPPVDPDLAFELGGSVPTPGVLVDVNDVVGVREGFLTDESGTMPVVFEISLLAPPTGPMTVTLFVSDSTEGTLFGGPSAQLDFTSANYNFAQTIILTGLDDVLQDGDVGYTVNVSVSSADPAYDGFSVGEFSITNLDNEPGIRVNPRGETLVSTESGGSSQFAVNLMADPTDTVTLNLSVSDTQVATVSPDTIQFSPGTGLIPQFFTVTGRNDGLDNGHTNYTVDLNVTAAAAEYVGVAPVSIPAVNLDDLLPAASITFDVSSPTNSPLVGLEIAFTEGVVGLNDEELIVSNATLARQGGTSGDSVYTYLLQPLGSGTVTVELPDDTVADVAGNPNLKTVSPALEFDFISPMPVLASVTPDPFTTGELEVEVDFGEPVVELLPEALVLTNGTLSNINANGNNSVFIVSVIPVADGPVTVDVEFVSTTDLAGNPNFSGTPLTRVFDTVAPRVLSMTALSPVLTNSTIVIYSVQFSEPVLGVNGDDFMVTLLGGNLTVAVLGANQFSDTVFQVAAEVVSGGGTLRVDVLNDGTILDLAGRPLEAGFTSPESVEIDRIGPTVLLESTAPNPVLDTPFVVTLSASEPIGAIDESAITVAGGNATIQNLAGSNGMFVFEVVPLAEGDIALQVEVAQIFDLAGNPNPPSNVLARYAVPRAQCDTARHTADIDGVEGIDLSELLRVVQFFTVGGFGCDVSTEDGFVPGGTSKSCCPHDADFDVTDGKINLTELLRIVQLYNAGGYAFCPALGTEDGFCLP